MTIEFAKLVNRLNNHSATLTVEKIVSEIEALRKGERKIYQIKRGEVLCEKYAHEISCASDLERGYDIWLTSTDMMACYIVLDDILFKLCMAGFSEDNIADRLYAFVIAYNTWVEVGKPQTIDDVISNVRNM